MGPQGHGCMKIYEASLDKSGNTLMTRRTRSNFQHNSFRRGVKDTINSQWVGETFLPERQRKRHVF